MRYSILIFVLFCGGCVGGDLATGADASLGTGGSAGGGGGSGVCQPGSRQCVGVRSTQLCNSNGQWTVPRDCVSGVCQDGVCQRSCDDSCTPGESKCTPTGLQTCERGGNQCGSWGAPEACAAGLVCLPGGVRCEPEQCVDQCNAPGESRCTGESAYSSCDSIGGCLRWSDTQPCSPGETCSGGRCGQTCQDSCVEGNTICLDEGRFQVCGRQANGCLDYGAPQPCEGGTLCSFQANRCEDPCPNPPECQLVRERCFQGGIQVCVPNQFNGCPTWGAIARCGANQVCDSQLLRCVDSCNDQCQVGARRCAGNGFQTCVDDNGCAVWGPEQACPAGQQCEGAGQCASACQENAVEARECGQCGVEERICLGGQWSLWGACEEGGACVPGDARACGNCGIQWCENDCQWGPCEAEGVCRAGDTQACGQCGEQLCTADCEWSQCSNTNNAWRECRDCGWQWCLPDGNWSDQCSARSDEPCRENGLNGFCADNGMCIYEI